MPKREYIIEVDERLIGSSLNAIKTALAAEKKNRHIRAYEIAELPSQVAAVVAAEGAMPQ